MSRAAVSLALRNQPDIPEATRERIKAIAEEVGYRPNPMVSALMAHIKGGRALPEAGSIVFLTAFPTKHGWRDYQTTMRYFAGATERAREMGYALDEVWLKEPGMTARRMDSILRNRGVEGVLLAPLPIGRGHVSLDIRRFAVATMGYSLLRPSVHRAVSYHYDSVRLALQELRRLGYRRIGLALNRSQDQRNAFNWTAGYLISQENPRATSRIPIHNLEVGDDQTLAQWLDDWKPDAILSGNSQILARLEKLGWPVPAKLGVAVLDRALTDDGVAGINQQPEIVGAGAVDLIVAQINRNERGIPTVPKVMLTGGVWVPGDTVRNLRANAPEAESEGPRKGIKAKRKGRKTVSVAD